MYKSSDLSFYPEMLGNKVQTKTNVNGGKETNITEKINEIKKKQRK